jgi:5-oxoprolinase (ATP-hydrolysing) subunit A
VASNVDLNADMGESFGRWTLGNDEALMPHLTSANIACGFHGGDPHVMRRTVALALEHDVGIGAHVALPDLLGFGRRRLAVSPVELRDYVLYQAGAMVAFADAAGSRLQHVKPHGALYTMAQGDPALAEAVADAVAELGDGVILLLAGKTVADAAQAAGVPFVPEGYVDLDYAGDGSLVIERVKQVRDPEAMAAKAVRLVTEGKVETLEGTDLELEARSICVHGDAPNAPEIAAALRRALEEAGIPLVPLVALSP